MFIKNFGGFNDNWRGDGLAALNLKVVKLNHLNMKWRIFLFILTGLALLRHAGAQEILQWRGIDRSGLYPATNLLPVWPPEGPEFLWESVETGNGYGSMAITRQGIYVNGEVDTVSYLFALDHQGKLRWKSPIGAEWTRNYPGSRSTPTVVGDLVYVTAGLGKLACFETATGKERWSFDLTTDFHGPVPRFGYSESVITDGDILYCMPGGQDTNVVALDRYTGRIRWISKGMGEMAAYCSPIIIRLPQRNILVTFSKTHLIGIDTRDGTLLWSYKQEGEEVDCQCNTPLYENGHIYCVAGNGNGAFKLKLSDDGTQVTEVWANKRCDNIFGGFIKLNDHLYTSGYEKRQYYVVDTQSGAITDSVKFDRGSVISAEGMLYLYNEKGMMGLFRPKGPSMEQVSAFRITRGTKAHFAHPVISDGILYVRHGKAVLAYRIGK